MNSIKLSLGIATFNRGSLAVKRIHEMAGATLPDSVEAFIIDNCSTDGSWEMLIDSCNGIDIGVYKNASNIGFAGNFVEVIRRAKGEYVLWLSDEDQVAFDNLTPLIEYLGRNMPDVLVCDYYKKQADGSLETYRSNSVGKIKPADFWSCSHLPGIVFNTKKTQRALQDYEVLKEKLPLLSSYYPHFLSFFSLLPEHNSSYWSMPVSVQADYRNHQHSTVNGAQYFHLLPRWQLVQEILKLLEAKRDVEVEKRRREALQEMLDSQKMVFYKQIRRAIAHERPDLLKAFDVGAKDFISRRSWYRRVLMALLRPRKLARRIFWSG